MIHIINQFPVNPDCLEKASNGDTFVFTENAVYAMQQNSTELNLAQKTFAHFNLCVRKADLLLRNLSISDLLKGVTIIEDFDYPSLLKQDQVIRSWNWPNSQLLTINQ